MTKNHWDNVYKSKTPQEVSWYEDNPALSLSMIEATAVGRDANIIDVGGGASKLCNKLLLNRYKTITVVDIAPSALEKMKEELNTLELPPDQDYCVRLLEADVTELTLGEPYDIWHDRAVFHFLTGAEDRKKYAASVKRALKTGGHLIMSTFSLEGPTQCSGLDVVRYSPETLHEEFGDDFELVESLSFDHITPSEALQRFICCRFKRVK